MRVLFSSQALYVAGNFDASAFREHGRLGHCVDARLKCCSMIIRKTVSWSRDIIRRQMGKGPERTKGCYSDS